jgi:LacI family transcriptional regulator
MEDRTPEPGFNPSAGTPPKQLNTLGMVVKTETGLPPRANPFYSHIIVGIEEACRHNQINLVFATLPVDEYNRPVEAPKILTSQEADGFLMVGTFVDETITGTIASVTGIRPRPIVLVDAYSNTASFDTVVSDNFQTAYQAVEYLIRKGHRDIGLVGSEPTSYPSLKQRRGGYMRALRENEITSSYIANFNIRKETARDPVRRLMGEHPQITALFGVNDEAAVNTIRALQEMGLRVPQDVSVMGYDDIDLAANTKPALTTFHVDTVTMGRAAVQLLMARLEYPEAARITLTIHPTLIERESVVER